MLLASLIAIMIELVKKVNIFSTFQYHVIS